MSVASSCSAQATVPVGKITTEQLTSTVEIVGPLGVRLGKLVTVEAVAEKKGNKIVSTWLNVDHVDGQKLKTPVRMEYTVYDWANVKRLENGKRLRLNVYQRIGMRGTPVGVMEETIPVTDGWEFGIHTWIVVINQTSPKPFAFPNKYYERISGGHPLEQKAQKNRRNRNYISNRFFTSSGASRYASGSIELPALP